MGFCLVAGFLCPAGASAEGAEPHRDWSQLQENCLRAAAYSAQHKGRAMLVLVDGKVVFERYDNGHTAEKTTHLHSATKSFWGPVVAAMIEDGLISSFDEPVSQTLPEWKGDPRKKRITVRQLLNLTSGLAEDIGQLQGSRGTAADKYSYAVGLGTVTEPGEQFRYGPSHYYLLGELMKRKLAKHRMDPLDYLRQRFLKPIGVDSTQWDRDPSGNPHIPNGAHLTARDWATFGQLLLQGGIWEGKQIIRKDLLEECFKQSRANPGYGLTFWLNRPGGRDHMGFSSRPEAKGGFIYPEGVPDLYAALGAGINALYVIPSLDMVIVRQAESPWAGERRPPAGGYSNSVFLSLLLKGEQPEATGEVPTPSGTAQQSPKGMIARFDRDGNEKLSYGELPSQMTRLRGAFSRLDRDGDGHLSMEELDRIASRRGRQGRGAKAVSRRTAPTTKREPVGSSPADHVVRISPPGENTIDPEILQALGKIAFQQQDTIWVGDLDPESGTFNSKTGKDFFMDSGAARLGETFNGPEFGLDSQGWAVYYAKEDNGNIQIWRSVWEGTSAKAKPVTSGERHQTQLVSKNPKAKTTRLLVIRGSWRSGKGVWFDEESPSQEHEFDVVETGVASARWVDDTFRFVFSQRGGDRRGQIVLVDTETGQRKTITNDEGDKTDPYGWKAPDYGNQMLVLAVVDDKAVAVYRQRGGRFWDRMATLSIPPESHNAIVGSAEPFVVGRKSYISLSIKSEKARIGQFSDGEIWIFGIDDEPGKRFTLRCDGGERPVARFDPEVYVGEEEAFVYYNVLTSEGVFEVERCRTGISAR